MNNILLAVLVPGSSFNTDVTDLAVINIFIPAPHFHQVPGRRGVGGDDLIKGSKVYSVYSHKGVCRVNALREKMSSLGCLCMYIASYLW